MQKELPTRKPTHLNGYDYSTTGAYFLTICTQDRKPLLSFLVGEGSPLLKLSPYGEVVEHWVLEISKKYKTLSVDRYVIMPNHIHLLISVTESGRGNPSPTVNTAIGWLKYQATKAINAKRATPGEKVFQRSFHDHIIRNQYDYAEACRYIDENPIRWLHDKLYIK